MARRDRNTPWELESGERGTPDGHSDGRGTASTSLAAGGAASVMGGAGARVRLVADAARLRQPLARTRRWPLAVVAMWGAVVAAMIPGSFPVQASGPPTVTAISPEAGSTLGGTTVTVTGTNFVAGATTVAFGSASGTSVSVTSATQLTVLSPPGASGLASVVVTTSGGSSASSTASQFDYTAPGGFARRKMRAAYGLSDAAAAQRELEALARHLDGIHPGAAASLREGLEETLTVQRLQLGPQLTRVLRSTNPIESMLSRGRSVARNVTRYRDGEMVLRWTAAGMTEARKSFRRIKGHRELGLLRAALRTHVEADVDQNRRIA